MFKENYCQQVASRIPEKQADKLIKATKSEESLVGKNGTIYYGFHKQLECEANYKYDQIFNPSSWAL